MTTAETQMDPLVPNMADFFPWQNPSTQLNSAVPWIETAISSVMSFVPFVGAFFDATAGPIAQGLLAGIGQTAGSLANGGVQQLQQDPE